MTTVKMLIHQVREARNPISGAMDFQQRLEFLAFHIKRHDGQVEKLLRLQKST